MSLQLDCAVGERLRFGEFELASVARSVWRRTEQIKLGSRALDILIALASRLGQILSREGTPETITAAEQHYLQALDWARRQGAQSWELRCAIGLARLWRGRARGDEARELLAKVYDRFTEGFATADVQAANALLHELS